MLRRAVLLDELSYEEKQRLSRHYTPAKPPEETHSFTPLTARGECKCGIEEIDSQLSGHLAGFITEIVGMPGAGRTRLCVRYASVASKSGNVLWFDGDGSLHVPSGTQLSYIRVSDYLELFAYAHTIGSLLSEVSPVLIVFDSIASVLRGSAKEIKTRNTVVWGLVRELKMYALQHGIAVLMTNQFTQRPDRIGKMRLERSMGFFWSTVPAHVLEIRETGGKRELKLLESTTIKEFAPVVFK